MKNEVKNYKSYGQEKGEDDASQKKEARKRKRRGMGSSIPT